MRTILLYVIAAVLAPSAFAVDYQLAHDSPDGFVHLRAIYDEGTKDSFVNVRHIISVHLITSRSQEDSKTVVNILTTRTRPAEVSSESAGSTNWIYELKFPDRPAAEAAAKKILTMVAGQAEQGGADQPATAPESKPEGDSKPQPESEGRSR
jgi:hypothetical protein